MGHMGTVCDNFFLYFTLLILLQILYFREAMKCVCCSFGLWIKILQKHKSSVYYKSCKISWFTTN